MTLKSYLKILIIASVLSAVVWIMIIYYIDPEKTGFIGFFLFYATMFFWLTGLFTFIGFRLRRYFLNNEVLYSLIVLSFRQAIWISLIIVGLLFMKSMGLLYWWDGVLYALSIFLLEVYFLTD
ncbi:MAG: hypothetical protein GF335_03045 [Candidatus Moranbacteria bacterium]|nr:hypothetical protein [Candidatus Moranbacteria bacterium]